MLVLEHDRRLELAAIQSITVHRPHVNFKQLAGDVIPRVRLALLRSGRADDLAVGKGVRVRALHGGLLKHSGILRAVYISVSSPMTTLRVLRVIRLLQRVLVLVAHERGARAGVVAVVLDVLRDLGDVATEIAGNLVLRDGTPRNTGNALAAI